ncbi:MAG: endolytic transglycosylase MltG [Actinomycetota bacterium]
MDGPSGGRHRRRGVPRAAVVLLAAIALVAAAGVAGARYLDGCREPEGERTPVRFTVEPGATGGTVVDGLHDLGVVPCANVARWDLRRSGLSSELRAGTYDLTTNMPPDEVFRILSSPPPEVPTTRLTIPEGYRLTQIAERVEEDLGIPARRFLRALERTDWSLPPYLPASASSPEGFLFPNTYDFRADGTGAEDVIQRLLEEFATQAATLPWANAEDLGVTPYGVVVIASMIEEEARADGDRALIAAVIYNRLAIGMTLGIDATLQYVDPDPSNGLVASDFEIDSPYNTRRSAGLPPTPIASPGLESLRAALEPADVDYLYYVLCGADGSHAFSDSFAAFTADKARCLG